MFRHEPRRAVTTTKQMRFPKRPCKKLAKSFKSMVSTWSSRRREEQQSEASKGLSKTEMKWLRNNAFHTTRLLPGQPVNPTKSNHGRATSLTQYIDTNPPIAHPLTDSAQCGKNRKIFPTPAPPPLKSTTPTTAISSENSKR